MSRVVAPEILDTLPPEDPAARHSRRDLRRINACMRNEAWFRRTLARELTPQDRVLELGAGESVLHRCAPAGLAWDALDLAPRAFDWPRQARWHQTDVRSFSGWGEYSVVVGNLFFHHLADAELRHLGTTLAPSVRLLLASEPHRSRLAQVGFSVLCRSIRANAVTRHDGRVSIAGGFRAGELGPTLGLSKGWECRETASLWGACRLVARRAGSRGTHP